VEYERESRLLFFGVRFGINAAALWLAAALVIGFEIGNWQSLLAVAAIFAVINAFVKPFVDLIGLPVTCLTLGLFHLVINAAMLAFTVWLAGLVDFDVELDGFVAAFLAALLISVVSTLLSAFVGRPIRSAFG
jgi:putative membrane protein